MENKNRRQKRTIKLTKNNKYDMAKERNSSYIK